MDPLQVATDYAAEEGFRITRDAEGQWTEVHHPQGGARVQKDGTILCETNPLLKQVLEKKLAQARAKEAQLLEDPEGRVTIKFSAEYEKMPADVYPYDSPGRAEGQALPALIAVPGVGHQVP